MEAANAEDGTDADVDTDTDADTDTAADADTDTDTDTDDDASVFHVTNVPVKSSAGENTCAALLSPLSRERRRSRFRRTWSLQEPESSADNDWHTAASPLPQPSAQTSMSAWLAQAAAQKDSGASKVAAGGGPTSCDSDDAMPPMPTAGSADSGLGQEEDKDAAPAQQRRVFFDPLLIGTEIRRTLERLMGGGVGPLERAKLNKSLEQLQGELEEAMALRRRCAEQHALEQQRGSPPAAAAPGPVVSCLKRSTPTAEVAGAGDAKPFLPAVFCHASVLCTGALHRCGSPNDSEGSATPDSVLAQSWQDFAFQLEQVAEE